MQKIQKPEVWLRGPLPAVPALLQPVAHALLQAREEVNDLGENFDSLQLWEKPAGVASAGFHLQHLSGVLDRLFTYARGEALSEEQLGFLKNESQEPFPGCTFDDLVKQFNLQIDRSLVQIRETDPSALTEVRLVGRGRVPSTLLGLLFHAAEHTQRHLGQLLVTVRILSSR